MRIRLEGKAGADVYHLGIVVLDCPSSFAPSTTTLSFIELYIEAAVLGDYDYDVIDFVIVHLRSISDSLRIIFGTNQSMTNLVFTRLMITSCVPLRSMASSYRQLLLDVLWLMMINQ